MSPFDLFQFESAQSPVQWHHFRVKGGDAASFLQGQTTADVTGLQPGHFKIQALVDRTGKIEAHFYLLNTHSGLEILVPTELAATVSMRFQKFVVSEDAELEDVGSCERWVCLGPRALSALGCAGFLGGEPAVISEHQFTGVAVTTAKIRDEFLAWQGEPTLETPYHVGELINQTRLFETAVDMKKGCFPGQETVAKVHHNRGAAWASVLMKALPPEVEAPAEITIEDKKVAKILHQEFNDGERWCIAEVLRDVRVEGLILTTPTQQKLHVQSYPRFATETIGKAKNLFYQGTDAFQKEDDKSAFASWEKAIALAPDFSDPYEAIGVLLGRQGKYDEAIEWMRKLLQVDSTSVMAHTNMSLFLMKLGKIQEAEDHKSLATVASFASFGRQAQEKRAVEEQQKKEEQERLQREGMFRQVLEIDPDDALANYGLGSLCLERKQFQEAKSYFETVLRSEPNYSVAYLGLGKALIQLSEKAEAREVLERGVKVAAKKGDMMPANEMQGLIARL